MFHQFLELHHYNRIGRAILIFLYSFYGDCNIIGRAIAQPTLPEPQPMNAMMNEPELSNIGPVKSNDLATNIDPSYSLVRPNYWSTMALPVVPVLR